MMDRVLTASQISTLQGFASRGDRYGYWNYLGNVVGDPYAKLALGVVTNETLSGYVANEWAKNRAATLGVSKTQDDWWTIGVGIMNADLKARRESGWKVELSGRVIYDYHTDVFNANGLDSNAWTARQALEAAKAAVIRSGGTEVASEANLQEAWRQMLGETNAFGYRTGGSEIVGAIQATRNLTTQPNTGISNSFHLGVVANAGASYVMAMAGRVSLSERSTEKIGVWSRDASTGKWFQVIGGQVLEPNASQAAELNQTRQFRIQKFGPNTVKVAEIDPSADYNVNEVTNRILAAGEPSNSSEGDEAGSIPVSLRTSVDALEVARVLGDYDLRGALYAQIGEGIRVELRNGTVITISRDGPIQVASGQVDANGNGTIRVQQGFLTVDMSKTGDSVTYQFTDNRTGQSVALTQEQGRYLLSQGRVIFDEAGGRRIVEYVQSSDGQYQKVETTLNSSGQTTSRSTTSIFEDGSTVRVVNFDTGSSERTITNADGSIFRRTQTTLAAGGRSSDSVTVGGDGQVQSRTHTDFYYDDFGNQSRIETVTTPTGTIRTTYDNDGNVFKQEPVESGSETLDYAIGATASFLSLLQAAKTGKPAGILVSGVNTLAAFQTFSNNGLPNLTLSGVGTSLSALSSLYNLGKNIERGDALGIIASGAQTVRLGATAYAQLMGYESIGSAVAGKVISQEAGALLQSVSDAVPYLNLINDLVNGNEVAVVIDLVALAFPPAAPFLAIASMIFGDLFGGGDPPDPWGNGKFVWKADGSIEVFAEGAHGGEATVRNALNSLKEGLDKLILEAEGGNASGQIGIVANRLPSLSYERGTTSWLAGFVWKLHDIDPVTGADRTLTYNSDLRPIDAVVGSPEYFRSMGEQFIYRAESRQAITAMWEVETARLQTLAGDPQAGMREIERAQRNNQLAPATTVQGDTQSWRPIVLDLNGNGIEVLSRTDTNVFFDVDDTNFKKDTGWIGAQDAFLVLDKNFNGAIDSATELFSNGLVADSAKGLPSLGTVDADANGDIDSADPVFNQLRLWIDLNTNGIVDTGEVNTLADLGITSLHYNTGTFDRNGVAQPLQLGSPDLVADTFGVRSTPRPNGFLLETTNGQVTLRVNKVKDLSNIVPGKDQIDGVEDVAIEIAPEVLLSNDKVGIIGAQGLIITSVSDARHGSVVFENGVIRFVPEANYFGSEAGFNYIVRDANGNTALSEVVVDFAAVNDRPVSAGEGKIRTPIYGYSQTFDTNGGTVLVPFNLPGYGYDAAGLTYAYRDSPIDFSTDQYNGKLSISDPDNTSFSYQLVQGNHGNASIDADGSWHYTPTQAIGGFDAFQVIVSDNSGGSTVQLINVPLPNPSPEDGFGGGETTETETETEAEAEAEAESDPIVLDLDQNGITLSNAQTSQAFYDANGDGWRHRMGWITGGDALLAYDANRDGLIAGRNEINFRDYQPGAKTDLEGLVAFDSNQDGRISALDSLWDKLVVWRDSNGNGLSEAGEMMTLDQSGVQDISLTSDKQFTTQNGNAINGMSSATLVSGAQIAVADVSFQVTNQVLVMRPDGTQQVATRNQYSAPAQVSGSALNDVLLGNTGSDRIVSGDGDDFISDDQGNDVIEAGAGNDTVYSGADVDVITAGQGNDTVFSGKGNDIILGGGGADALLGEEGNDVVFGGAGNDLIDGGLGNDVLAGDDGDDSIFGGDGVDALFGGQGHDILIAGRGNDRLQGEAGDDTLDGGAGDDDLYGGLGDDNYVIDSLGDVIHEEFAAGTDTVRTDLNNYQITANIENLTLLDSTNASLVAAVNASNGVQAIIGYGNDANNRLVGNTANNTLYGMAGNDVLDGWSGADTLVGGSGDDQYFVDHRADQTVELSNEGTDTVNATISWRLGESVENLNLIGAYSVDGTGNQLSNVLVGNVGDNVLDGQQGDDLMKGGLGNDTYVVDSSGDQVIELSGAGYDLVRSIIDYSLAANVENLALEGAATQGTGNELDNVLSANDLGNHLSGLAGNDYLVGGAGQDSLLGGDGSDILSGRAGNDTLDGGTGADILEGGAANDSYVVDNANDVITELLNEGIDGVVSSVNYSLASNVENLTLTGPATVGTGNELANALTANALGNILSGLSGADILTGGTGADTLLGGADDDTLIGNGGNDSLDGGTGADTMNGGVGDDQYLVDNIGDIIVEALGAGTDSVVAGVSYTLASNVENLTLSGAALVGTGNELANQLIANDLGNTLSGLAGADVLIGGTGADTLLGGSDNDSLTGNAGSDVLDGGTGSDTMQAGAGDDRYVVDSAGDAVTELANEGIDSVDSNVNYTLTSHVENLRLTGAALNGTGNELANTLEANDLGNTLSGLAGNDVLIGGTGNDILKGDLDNDTLTGSAGADLLDGGFGADAMSGGLGNDSYLVEDIGDIVNEFFSEGTDHVTSAINYVLPEHVENLLITGAAVTASGNALDNTITGNALANIIDGKAGNDTMIGAAGDDRYIVESLGDAITEIAAEGNDTVYASVNYATSANVENLILTGAAITGTGNALANTLVGNVNNNTLFAGAGADLLAGGAGNDSLDGGLGDDVYLWTQGDGRDSIVDVGGTDTIRFGAGITLDSIAAREYLVGTQRRIFVSVLNARGDEQPDQGIDFALNADGSSPIEHFIVASGQSYNLTQVKPPLVTTNGTAVADTLTGSRADDTMFGDKGVDILYGRSGHDTLWGGFGADKLFGEAGDDKLYGENDTDWLQAGSGNDLLVGDTGNDTLLGGDGDDLLDGGKDMDILDGGDGADSMLGGDATDELWGGAGDDIGRGGAASDLLAGGAGNDQLYGESTSDVLVGGSGADTVDGGDDSDFIDAGTGNDTVLGGLNNDFIAGGKGDDTITAGDGIDIMVFNKGDGQDTVITQNSQQDIVSLGGGIRYADLAMSKSGNDLLLKLGSGDQMLFKDWYTGTGGIRNNVNRLQMVTASNDGDFAGASADKLLNRKVVLFDFTKLVQAFDVARTANPILAQWSVTTASLNTAYLSGSNTQALGGDLAFRYATLNDASSTESTYGDFDWSAVRTRTANFGNALQTLSTSAITPVNPWAALHAGTSLIVEQATGAAPSIQVQAPLTPEDLVTAAFAAQQQLNGQTKPGWA